VNTGNLTHGNETNPTHQTANGSFPLGPLPRTLRKPARSKEDRGLPPDEELEKLAATYLKLQIKLWPELVKQGLLEEPNPSLLTRMVEDFKHRHRGGQIDIQGFAKILKTGVKLAGNYDRYSCDNSSPNSIIDQMANSLRKARDENRFIPWEFIYCDYSQSGLTSSRQGYTSYKLTLANEKIPIETTYVDDFTRASRDDLEWWRLASLSKRLRKRMIGASDGFDLNAIDWDIKIALYGLLSRLFIKGLREKVKRGMRGAAGRGTCLGLLSLGFTRQVSVDQNGNPNIGRDSQPVFVPCIDPITSPMLRLLYELFTQKNWSRHRITKHFNSIKLNGSDSWTSGGITKLLWSPASIGVFIWNRTRREYDLETEKWVKTINPRNEWNVHVDKKLAIIPLDWWRTARRKIAARRFKHPRTGQTQSKNQASATTLFSGTLLCGDCGRELTLYRSHKKYKVISCPNGATGAHGCKLSSSKSTRIIEKALLGFLLNQLLTDDAIHDLVNKANGYLADEVRKPLADVGPIKKRIAEKVVAIKKLFERIEYQDDPNLCDAFEKRISEHQKEENRLKQELRLMEDRNVKPPPPLNLKTVTKLLGNLREILNQEIPLAAEALRALTGPITVRQELEQGKRGAKWIAHFTPNLLNVLCKTAKEKDYPDAITLEYLCSRNWITSTETKVSILNSPIYEQIAEQVVELTNKGFSSVVIAKHLGTTSSNVFYARHFGQTGRRPKQPPVSKRTGKGKVCKYKEIADEVVRLREIEKKHFSEIAESLSCNPTTIQRAYDYKRPNVIEEAMRCGKRPKRGRSYRLDPRKVELIDQLLRSGKSLRATAKQCKCGVSTVVREKARLASVSNQGLVSVN